MKDPARTWNGTVVLRIMEKQRTADRLALCEQMDLEARVAEIAAVAALADRAHRSAIVVELARALLNRLPAVSSYGRAGNGRAGNGRAGNGQVPSMTTNVGPLVVMARSHVVRDPPRTRTCAVSRTPY
jgi:hypothetical protein